MSKRFVSFIIAIILFLSCFASKSAAASVFMNTTAFCVGTDFGLLDADTSADATNAAFHYGCMGLTCNTVTIPTRVIINGTHPNGNKNMASGIVFLSGHGNPSLMSFNYKKNGGQYHVGITSDDDNFTGSSGCFYYTISNYQCSDTALYVFAGCQTAAGTDNLAKTAFEKGAKITIGWTVDVSYISHPTWLNRFNSALSDGLSVDEACDEADSYSYFSNTVKHHATYGHSNHNPMDYIGVLLVSSKKRTERGTVISQNIDEKSAFALSSEYMYNLFKDHAKDFHIEETKVGQKIIWDYIYYLDSIRTSYAYTFIFDDNRLLAFDNTNGETFDSFSSKLSLIAQKTPLESIDNIQVRDINSILSECKDSIKEKKQSIYYDALENRIYSVTEFFAVDSDGLSYSDYLLSKIQ